VPKPTSNDVTPRMISDFCRTRLPSVLSPRECDRMRTDMLDLRRLGERPARKGGGPDWAAIAARDAVLRKRGFDRRGTIQFAFDALDRTCLRSPARTGHPTTFSNETKRLLAQPGNTSTGEAQLKPVPTPDTKPAATEKRRPGAPRRPVVEFRRRSLTRWRTRRISRRHSLSICAATATPAATCTARSCSWRNGRRCERLPIGGAAKNALAPSRARSSWAEFKSPDLSIPLGRARSRGHYCSRIHTDCRPECLTLGNESGVQALSPRSPVKYVVRV
jgi:hypothetical protein